MTIVSGKLKTRIDARLENSPTGLDCCNLENASNFLDQSVSKSATLETLPLASENKGRLIYVESTESYVFSNGFEWVTEFTTDPLLELYTWGFNGGGRLGDGSTIDRSSPGTTSGGGTTWCQVNARLYRGTAAVKSDGTLWTWGCGICGQLGTGDTTVSRSSPGTTAGGGTNWCQVEASRLGTIAALKTDGTLWTWGSGQFGILGDGSTTSRSSPGTTIDAGTTWCQVSVGGIHMAAVKSDGTLWTWGGNTSGTLGDGTTISRSSPVTTAGGGTDWCQVGSGNYNIGAIKTDGTLWTWGRNQCGQLGTGNTTSRCSPGTTVAGGTNWCLVAGDFCSCAINMGAIKTDGTLWTWGNNQCASLGDGTSIDRCSPVTTVGGGTNWCQMAIGLFTMAAVKTDGTLWSWGFNQCGGLGDGTTINRASPVRIADSSVTTRPWTQVSVGDRHAAAVAGIRVGIEPSSLV